MPLGRSLAPIYDAVRRHAAWLFVCAAYLFVSPYYERLNNPNENVRVWATRAIVEHHVLDIDAVEREWGWVNDKAKNERHVYSGKAPGTSLLGVPVLLVHSALRGWVGWPPAGRRSATFWLRLFAVKLPICAFLWAFGRYVERVTRSALTRDALLVALGLGTLFYPYGTLFVGHALAGAAAFAAFMLLDARTELGSAERSPSREGAGTLRGPPRLDEDGGSDRAALARLVGAGGFAGVAVVLEYQVALIAAALVAYAFVRYSRRALAMLLGALPPAAALGAYHTALFGRPWRIPYGNIENPAFIKQHTVGFHGLSIPHREAFVSFLISPAYGLFAFSPVLLLGVAAVIWLLVRGPRREAALFAAIAVLMFLFIAGMSNWRAGWCVGPRYITAVVPFLLAAVAHARRRFGARWWASAVLVGLTIPSVALNVVSGALYPHYPEVFDNPVFDLSAPLLAAGYVPYGLGWLLGLPGAWATLPVALAALAALSCVAGGDDPAPRRWAAHLGVAVAVAAAYLVPLSAYGAKPRLDEIRAMAVVRELWEPPAQAAASPSPSPWRSRPRPRP